VKIFVDTNVLASSLATRGLCNEVFEAVIDEHELLVCEQVLQELESVLTAKFRLPDAVVKDFLVLLRTECTLVPFSERRPISIKDQDDIAILSCAITGKADVFVTGDKELLDLSRIGRLTILSPRQLWLQLSGLQGPGR
jgi:putative PIN family toxin of toxin-antitoxin system